MGYLRLGGGNKDYSDYWKGKFKREKKTDALISKWSTHPHTTNTPLIGLFVFEQTARERSDSSLDALYAFLISAAYYFKCEINLLRSYATGLLSTQCAADGLSQHCKDPC